MEPYKANPREKEVKIPTLKLLNFRILKFTTGWSVLSSRHIKAIAAAIALTVSTAI